jgi:hypothetical protein
MTRIIVLVPLAEAKRRDPMLEILSMVNPQKFMETLVQTVHGPHIRLTTVYACKACTPAAEKVAAKAPSWAIVDIHRGPGPDRIGVGYGS